MGTKEPVVADALYDPVIASMQIDSDFSESSYLLSSTGTVQLESDPTSLASSMSYHPFCIGLNSAAF